MTSELRFSEVWPHFDALLWGAWLTLQLSTTAMVFGFLGGLVCAALRAISPRFGGAIVESYVQVVRNTPFLVQIFLIFFGLPTIGIRLAANEAGIVALVFNASAYISEIIRGGIESIARGQVDAGRALGLSGTQIFFYIILRPALQVVYPALTGQFTMLLLTSSVLSVISAEELTAVANNLSSTTFRTIEIYLVVGGIYLSMTLCLAMLFSLLGRIIYRDQSDVQGVTT